MNALQLATCNTECLNFYLIVVLLRCKLDIEKNLATASDYVLRLPAYFTVKL